MPNKMQYTLFYMFTMMYLWVKGGRKMEKIPYYHCCSSKPNSRWELDINRFGFTLYNT